MGAIQLKGLQGLAGLNAADSQAWMQRQINSGILPSDASYLDFDRLYRNEQFVNLFGIDAFNRYTNPTERDALFKHAVTQAAFDKRYKGVLDEDDYNYYNTLSDDGKLDLIGANIRTEDEIQQLEERNRQATDEYLNKRQETARKNWFTLGAYASDPLAVSSEAQTMRRLDQFDRDRQNQTIEDIVAKDALRRKENASPISQRLRETWETMIANGQMNQEEIDKQFYSISPYLNHYNAFKNEKELENFGPEDRLKAVADYYAILQQTGNAGVALGSLDAGMQNYIADQQKFWDRGKLFAGNLLTGTIGTILSEINGYIAMGYAIAGGTENASNFLKSWWAQYVDGIDKYNTFDPGLIDEIKKNGGVSPNQRIRRVGEDHNIFSADTAFDMMAMIKFLLPSLLSRNVTAFLTKGGNNLAWKMAKGIIGSTKNRILQQTALGAFNTTKYLIGMGGVAASSVGISNMYAMGTYEEALAEGENTINQLIEKQIDKELRQSAEQLAEFDLSEMSFNSEEERERQKELLIQKYSNDYTIRENIKEEVEKTLNKKELLHQNELKATEAYMVNATMETIRMGAENFLFRKWMLAKGTRANLGENNPYLRVRGTEDGLKLANKRQNIWKPILSNAWGGFESNYMDDVTARFGKEFGISRFNNFIAKTYDKEQYAGVVKEVLNPLVAAMRGASDAFGDVQSFWDGFIGLGGSFLQIIPANTRMIKGIKQGRRILDEEGNDTGKKRSRWEVAADIIYNPILDEVASAYQRERATQERIDNINKELSSEKGQKNINAIREALITHSNSAFASMSGSMLESADANHDEVFGIAKRFIELTNDPVYSEHPVVKRMKELHDQINNAKSIEDVADLVQEAQSRPDNSSGRQLSAEEHFQAMKDNAKKLEEMQERYQKFMKEIEKSPSGQLMPEDIKVQLAYQLSKDQNWKERLDSIASELGIGTEGVSNEIARYGTKKAAEKKSQIALHNIGRLDKKIIAVKDRIDTIKKSIKNRKKHRSLGRNIAERVYNRNLMNQMDKIALSQTETELEDLEKERQRHQENLDKANAAIERIEGYSKGEGTAVTLSSNEILGLSLEDMAYMLDPEHRDEYTVSQQQEIEKAETELAMRDSQYLQKIKDAAELQFRINENRKAYKNIWADPVEAGTSLVTFQEERKKEVKSWLNEKRWGDEFDRFDDMSPSSDEFKTEAVNMSPEFLEAYKDRSPERESVIDKLKKLAETSTTVIEAMDDVGLEEGSAERSAIAQIALNAVQETALKNGTPEEALEAMKAAASEANAPSEFTNVLEKVFEKINDSNINRQYRQPIETSNTDTSRSVPPEAPEASTEKNNTREESKKPDTEEQLAKDAVNELFDLQDSYVEELDKHIESLIAKEIDNLRKKNKRKIFGKKLDIKYVETVLKQRFVDNESVTFEDEESPEYQVYADISDRLIDARKAFEEKKLKEFANLAKSKVEQIGKLNPSDNVRRNRLLKNAAIWKIASGDIFITLSAFNGKIDAVTAIKDLSDAAPNVQELIDAIDSEINSSLINKEEVEESDIKIKDALEEGKQAIIDTQRQFEQNALTAEQKAQREEQERKEAEERRVEAERQAQIKREEEARKKAEEERKKANGESPEDGSESSESPETPAPQPDKKRMESDVRSLPIDAEIKNNPTGILARIYNKYHIVQKLSSDLFQKAKKVKGKVQVYFIADGNDAVLAKQYKESFGDKYSELNDRLIFAAVEVKEQSMTTIYANGKHYQPIAVMPSSNADISGAGHMGQVRELASKKEGMHLVRTDNGVLTTELLGTGIKSTMSFTKEKKGRNVEVKRVVADDIPLNNRNDQAKLNEGRGIFLKGLKIVERKDKNSSEENETKEHLVFSVKKLGSTEDYEIEVFNRDVTETLDNSGQTIDKAPSVYNFNTQTKKAGDELLDWAEKFPVDQLQFNTKGNLTEESQKLLDEQAKKLNSKVGSYMYLDTRNSGDAYSVSVERLEGGDIIVKVDYVNTFRQGDTKPLIRFNSKSENLKENTQLAEQFLSNLIYKDANAKEFHLNADGKSIVKWQIDWDHVRSLAGQETKNEIPEWVTPKKMLDNLKDMYDSNIFYVDASTTTFQQNVEEVKMQSPFNSKGEQVYNKPPQVANTNNGSQQPALNDGPGNRAANKPAETPKSGKQSKMAQALEKLREHTKKMKLKEAVVNGEKVSWYENKETREKSVRMTSAMYADIEARKKGVTKPGKDNPYLFPLTEEQLAETGTAIPEDYQTAAPSSAIGNTMDAFYRDLFNIEKSVIEAQNEEGYAGTQKEIIQKILENADFSKYPNTDQNSLRTLAEKMLLWKMNLERPSGIANGKGLTFVAEHLVLSGKMAVRNPTTKGGEYINVAGTVDLLAFDEHGNLYIFDFKTKHSENFDNDFAKWEMQTSGYADMLTAMLSDLGISVAGLYIIPINVKYPNPYGRGGNTIYTSRKDAQGLQKEQLYTQPAGVNSDPVKFKGASPDFNTKRTTAGSKKIAKIPGMPGVIPINRVPLEIDYNQLDNMSKSIYEKEFNEEGTEIAPPSTDESGFVNPEVYQRADEEAPAEAAEEQAPQALATPQSERAEERPQAPAAAQIVGTEKKYDSTLNASVKGKFNIDSLMGEDDAMGDLEDGINTVEREKLPPLKKEENKWSSFTAEEQEFLKKNFQLNEELTNKMDEDAIEKMRKCIQQAISR